jgi:hypothetical protein
MHKVKFVSQRVYAFPHVTCGVAATMMLLKFHFHRQQGPSYRELRTALGICGANPTGVDPDDVTRYFRQNSIRYRATRRNTHTTWLTLKRGLRHSPTMVGMGNNTHRWGASGHWIVVVEITAEVVVFLDPHRLPAHEPPLRMRLATFRRQWDGSSIQIVGFK